MYRIALVLLRWHYIEAFYSGTYGIKGKHWLHACVTSALTKSCKPVSFCLHTTECKGSARSGQVSPLPLAQPSGEQPLHAFHTLANPQPTLPQLSCPQPSHPTLFPLFDATHFPTHFSAPHRTTPRLTHCLQHKPSTRLPPTPPFRPRTSLRTFWRLSPSVCLEHKPTSSSRTSHALLVTRPSAYMAHAPLFSQACLEHNLLFSRMDF
jgi:hypothetical protein